MKISKFILPSLLIVMTTNLFASEEVLNKNLCSSSGFQNHISYIFALRETQASYTELVNFYIHTCEYKSLGDLHSSSADVIELHNNLESENAWKCIPIPYKNESYTNFLKIKKIGNYSLCFSNHNTEDVYKISFKSKFKEVSFESYRSFRFFTMKYPTAYEFQLQKHEIEKIKSEDQF